MVPAEELLIKIKAIESLGGFDALEGKVKQAQTDMKAMESTTNASTRKMKTDLEQVNNTNFSGLNNKFKSTITSMTSTAASGAKAIKNSLESAVDGIDGAITSVTAGLGVMELFDKAMDKALTKTQLKNAKPKDYGTITDQYQQFTTKSSASDDDISKMLRYTYGGNSNETYKALNAIDAISYSADKLQRAEGIRGWGTYISGGWTAASGMMKDEPLTAAQQKELQGAKTYDERIKAMEDIAKQKGNVDKFGNSLSTTVDGPLGKYNQALAAEDAVIRGATSSFETLMTWIAPVIAGFMALDPSVQSTIGTILTAGIVITAVGAGLGILSKLLSPVWGGLTKIKDALTGAKDVKKGVDTLKNSLNGSKLTSTVNIKAATVNVNGKVTGTTPKTTTTTTPTKPTKTTPSGKGTSVGVLGMLGITAGTVGAEAAGLTYPVISSLQAWFDPKNKGLTSFQNLRSGYLAKDADAVLGMITGSDSNVAQTAVNRGNKYFKSKGITTGNQPGILDWLTGNKPKNNMNVPGILDIADWGKWLTDPVGGLTNLSSPSTGPYLSQKLFGGLGSLFSPANASPTGYNGNLTGSPTDIMPGTSVQSATINPPNGWKLPDISPDSILNTIKSSILGTLGLPGDMSWDKVEDTIKTKIFNILGLPGNLSWDQVKAVIKQKILNALGLPGDLSWSRVSGWVLGKVFGSLHLPGNLTWDMIRGWIINAVWKPGNTGGDSGADTGLGKGPYAETKYVASTSTTAANKTTSKTVIHAPITIESISNREEGDRAIQAITLHIKEHNDANGN